MALEEDLVTYLKTQAGLTALVGDRIHALRLPSGSALPAVTYQLISAQPFRSHSGSSGLRRPRLQLKAISGKYSQTKAVAALIAQAVDNYKGSWGASQIQASFEDNEIDAFDPEANTYQLVIDITVFHRI